MVIVEMREAVYDDALDKLEEAKHHSKKCKLALCELEDLLYDCYEAEKETEDDYEEREDSPENEDYEMNYRSSRRMRNMRRNMRMKHDGWDDDEEMRGYRRGSYRRRNRMGRFI